MKILHTSDWHIGRTLYGRKRYEEFAAFLNWLAATIEAQQVDILLVAGDIFDTSAPSHRAQQLYYRFLCRVATSCCRHVIVIGGNHDSPSFLNAPQELLKALDVHVIGSITENSGDEVLLLHDLAGVPELIVCAVPYLRDRDIRTAQAGESVDDKERKLLEGLRNHYAEVGALAEEMNRELGGELGGEIPIVAMGHLFTAGGKTVDGDGVRELYVGSLAHVTADIFPAGIDYVALGHLHVPQKINGSEVLRYSGSPVAMGFGEARQQKSICLIEFVQRTAQVTTVDVPVFQQLERIRGTWDEIAVRILELSLLQYPIWLEIVYDGADVIGDLRERLENAVVSTQLEILRVQNRRIIDRVLRQVDTEETLDDLDVDDVFTRCLEAHSVPQEQQRALLHAYRETILSLEQEDAQAE